MFLEYSICPNSTVYVLRAQFMSSEYGLCHKSTQTVYVTRVQLCPRVQFMSVYVPRVQFMSSEYGLCSKSTVMSSKYSLCLTEYSLCPTVYVPIVPSEYSL